MTGKIRIATGFLAVAVIILEVLAFSNMQEGIEVEALLMVAKAFSVWLFVPFVNFLEYLKRSEETIHSSQGRVRRKLVLSALSVGLAALCAVDFAGASPGADLSWWALFLVLWLSLPMLNFFLGMTTTNGKTVRLSIAIVVYYLSWILPYALDGNPQDREDANYLYQLFAPFVMAMLCPVVIYGEYCARRVATWLRSRNETALGSE
jgi:hypothetical protein